MSSGLGLPERNDAEAALQRAYGAANGNRGPDYQAVQTIGFGLVAIGRCILACAAIISEAIYAIDAIDPNRKESDGA